MFQKIQTNRLLLRNLLPGDADAMFAYRSHPVICQYQSWEPQSALEVESFIDKMAKIEFDTTGWYQIAMALESDGSLIGDCGIHFLEADRRTAEFGISIAPERQGNGYATEALNAILNMLFADLRKHRVFASVDPLNLSSMALMKRLELRQEAHFVQSLWFKNKWTDDAVFAMLASEWSRK
jgi:RimJ/RimL family protein N-acetyltransferase